MTTLEDDLRKLFFAGAAAAEAVHQLGDAAASTLGRVDGAVAHVTSPETLGRVVVAGVAAAAGKLAEEALGATARPRAELPAQAPAPKACGAVVKNGPYAGLVCVRPHGHEGQHSAPTPIAPPQPAPTAPVGARSAPRPPPPPPAAPARREPAPAPAVTHCERHQEQPWRGTLLCGVCRRVFQVTDPRATRFAPERCPCGAQLLPETGPRPQPCAARPLCGVCFRDASATGGFSRG